ncbi:HNH endonuclease signature motif containing protein [Smaragdicoccus niigatensis]|uniref:HNH endonuclease signature motif containing protein n=1 Tax=Smaragdicoccus niigatensis TaxID=359359 RepID=UPI0003A0556D|nr:HNH endonuclease signature motif containing protein [Smaragdicoccus niigatensis]
MFDSDIAPDTDCMTLDDLVQLAQAENAAACRKAMAAHEFWDWQIASAPDPVEVQFSAITEVAVALGISKRAADLLVETGSQLWHRLPLVHAAFEAGVIDYASVSTIVSVFRDACAETIDGVEPHLVPLAQRLTPGPLRRRLWALWFQVNPEEAAAARELNQRVSRTVYVRQEGNGLAWLSACITDLEGHEADRLINEIAETVCPKDPRTRNQRRADGLMALLHGETVLVCRCEDVDCPKAGVEQPTRRKFLLQILVDIKTLLALKNGAATLDDGTPIPTELVRELAGDAAWQGILAELAALAEKPRSGDSLPLVDCTRVRKPATVPAKAPRSPKFSSSALKYKPDALTAAVVRAMYPTCTFPGCCVPSRDCELDHINPFNHDNPILGGLTIVSNLQPVCKAHHQLKTKKLWGCRRVKSGVLWTSPNGLTRITRAGPYPANLAPNLDQELVEPDTGGWIHADDLEKELDHPTWWETHIGPDITGPTLNDIAMANDPAQQQTLRSLRRLYMQHRQVENLRDKLAPPPF